ncbi:histidinol-phosphate transaminase [Hydrogenophaga sp.]|uniref:pyridoxal phosphate-dependent aminotransferase n=1 Tax=Hydrogenophaga sp. TaxID=1904254 RepID=UPI00272EFEF8|nr:histidinol-phosphate transaminase [Hydrogenophaga sp.]MDP2074781.1 histidinol-phosphate transaminase [Hydrogenophaga sp.]MDP3108942.1 histidinol-phosphate transaminase [Hydrogenophaga sp.]
MTLPVRPAVLNSPDYPFSPVDAPIKLDQNESFADFPDRLKAIALERLRHLPWHRYTDLHAESLSEAIAAHDGWSASGTVVTTGSNVLIALLIQLCALGGRVVTVTPNFALYALDARLLGASLTEVPLRDDASLDMDAVIASLGASQSDGPHGVIYIPRPHAPTGSLCALDELERLAQACPGWLLVVDEAYHHFAPDDARELARRHDHVVLLRTLSKAWGLAGLRLGYALASDSVARQLRKLVPPFGVSLMQSVCAQVALEHAGYVRERVATTLQERERMATALQAHPTWRALPSHANFLLIRTPDASAAHAALLAQGVLVRRQDSLHGLQGCIRVTVGTADENSAFLRAAGLGA